MIVWTKKARAALLPRRDGDGPKRSKVHKPGLLLELRERVKEWQADRFDFWWRMKPWHELRRLVAESDRDTYPAARADAEEARTTAHLSLRCAIAFAFPTERAWSEEDARSCLALAPVPSCADGLIPVLEDAVLLASIVRARLEDATSAEMIAGFAADIVLQLEDDAPSVLAILLERYEAAHKRQLVATVMSALACVRTKEAAAMLAARIDQPGTKTIAAQYFRDAPELASEALGGFVKKRTKKGEAARTLLPAAQSLALPDAAPDQLPEVLREPPWRTGVVAALPVVEDIDANLDGIVPVGEDRHAWAAKIDWVPPTVVLTPRAAFPIVHALFHRSDARDKANTYVSKFPEMVAFGLVPFAIGPHGARRTDAGRMLRRLAMNHTQATERAIARFAEPASSAARAVLSLDALLDCPPEPPTIPKFVRTETLPRPLVRDKTARLSLEHIQTLIEMFAFSTLDFPYAGIDAVKAVCDPDSLEDFAWELFSAWLTLDTALDHSFALQALGWIGGDKNARRLAPKVRAWPLERAYARTELGIDVLLQMKSEVALVHIAALADGSRYPEVRKHAQMRLEQAAKALSLTEDQLADRMVPDLDLDADGSMTLDFGSRTFRVTFDDQFHPVLFSSDGQRVAKLPNATKADDPQKAKAAAERWAGLKNDAAATTKQLLRRFESAMCEGRTWSMRELMTVLLPHPVVGLLVRRLVWCSDGSFFRICEDRSLADSSDAPVVIDETASVRVPHPLDMDRDTIDSFGRVFGEYEILQPFEQLGRNVYEMPSDVLTKNAMRIDKTIETPKLFSLEYRGWMRQQGGFIQAYNRTLGTTRLTLSFEPGFQMRALAEQKTQTLTQLWTSSSFANLSPIQRSEVLRDVAHLGG